jgi:alpha-galactosidase
MILSMANYTDPSWAWGGGQIGHLWRTSYDIGPSMGSVYYCADTTAGDIVIHPAFNGLWQFAGPGRWNDPDMLEVGNLQSDRENRTHFALWCILAAPLMAGNDLRSMTDSARDVLVAKEVIKIDQDPRGVQGYKVFDDGDHEVYNKPLSDGATAVLLLNKGAKDSDLTVSWDQIGLKGPQMVRDLWQRKDLGIHTNQFTAKDLPQHDHRLLKIGTPGRLPLPLPKAVAPAKYMVTRKGKTHLSDLYYVWRSGEDAPSYNSNSEGRPIAIGGTPYQQGFGFKGNCQAMFKLNGKAHRFRAVIGLDAACQSDDSCRFKVRNLDPIGPTSLLYDSGKMTRDTAPATVDVDVSGVDCLILECESKKALANWAEAYVLVD